MAEAPQPRIKEQAPAEAEADGAPSGPRITTETQLRSRPSVGRLSGTRGVASGATRLADETEHTDRLGGATESDSVLTFRRSPLPDEPDAGRLAAEEAEADTDATEEPQISALGPVGAPEERIDGAPVSTPSLDSPVAESLGMRPGAEDETVRISRSLPSAQPAEDRTGEEAAREQTEAGAEPSPVIEEVETPRTEERVTDQELPLAEQEEPGTAMQERPLPEDAIVELEPGEYRSPEYRGPEESTASPDGAEREDPAVSDMSRLASPADGAEDEGDDEAAEEEGPAPPSRRPPEEAAEEPAEEPTDEQQRVASREPSEASKALEGLTMIQELDGASYYLQVGAYSDIESARRMVRAMEETYPMAVNPVSREDGTLYRVLVGPLSDDEKGATLYRVRARGHRDAFLRAGSTVGSAGSS
jgi:cell division protein FtsN